MNLLTTIIVANVITLSANVSAHQTQKLVAADNNITTEICMAVASNKPIKLITALRNNRLNITKANKSIHCNGMTLEAFGEKHHAVNTATQLQRYQIKTELYTSL
ncbi:hypothetical protein CJF42_14015 [Pseudoalteromonas sp. NBT06-2]|uniref:DUF3718 domain-containing protein n=1 Tax=Pseudoalteromonas sp. NBT06-2 TaxID=2025950 RepID=UPI000BA7583A|nr:DUF3718 domain-containing protein [Pseudoalteromonas sp. NBT06-2]PAJ73758.1 hypothetical protein CJF42_14015 [Pseudoalteromonas sp. NBT06-2]